MAEKGYKPQGGTPELKCKAKSVGGVKSVPMDNGFRSELEPGTSDIQKGVGSGGASKTMDGVVSYLNKKVKIGGKP